MPLNINNQLTLLHDILDEQTEDCCGSVAEYQQMNRLIKSMMANNSITSEDLKEMLPAIYDYCKQGENTKNAEEHITANKQSLKQWIGTIRNTIELQ